LHPFIRTVAERCEGIDTTSLQTTINHSSMMFGFVVRDTGKTLTNTHPALMAVINGQKDVVFSARRISQPEAKAVAIAKLIDENRIDARQIALMESLFRPHRSEELESTAQDNEKLIAETMSLSALEDDIVYVPFAKDAFVFLQHRHNPVRSLTLEQYQGIFSGRYMKEHSETPLKMGTMGGPSQYQSWKDVSGFGGVVKPFIRNVESGSEELMQTLVMKDIEVHKDFKPQRLDTMGGVFERLESSPTGIAYAIYHYDRYMVFNPNTRVMAVNGVFPNAETIASGEYPLVYEVVLVHRKNPGERVERFVEWLLSEEGQALVRSVGYVPITESQSHSYKENLL
jgi:hypothetical protein